jgi:hypothetical protein
MTGWPVVAAGYAVALAAWVVLVLVVLRTGRSRSR